VRLVLFGDGLRRGLTVLAQVLGLAED